MKKLSPFIAVVLLGVMVRAAGAQSCPAGPGSVPNVAITGALSTIYGAPAANQRVEYSWGMTQQPGSFITTTIPTSKCSVFTDANGNLPTPPAKCTCFPQGASGWLTIGSGEPAKIIFPPFTTANISDILPVNAAMDPIVSEIDLCGSPTDVAFAVSNPPIGTIGPATLCPGAVTGLQGIPICTTPPILNQVLAFNGTQWCPANSGGGGGGGGPFNQCGTGGAGFGCDYKTTDDLTLTNGSDTVTSPDAPFVPGDVGKLIRIDDPKSGTSSQETFVGTIASVTDASTIHLSSVYTGPSVTTGNPVSFCTAAATPKKCCTGNGTGSCTVAMAMYGSAGDNTAWNNLMTTIGDISVVTRPAVFNCTKPILITGQLQSLKRSLDFAGTGISSLYDDAAGCAIIWMGTTDTTGDPMLRLTNNVGSRVHDLIIEGGNLHPPFAGIMEENLNSQGTPNYTNRIYNVKMGGLQNLNLGPDESNGDTTTTMTGNHIVGDTTVVVNGTPDLYPGEAVRFYDSVAGDEVRHLTNAAWCTAGAPTPQPYPNCTGVGTCPTCYTAGSATLNFKNGFKVAHLAANTVVQWVNKPPLVTGISLGPLGTQNDSNYFDGVDIWGGVNQGFFSSRLPSTNQAVNIFINNLRMHNFGIANDWPDNGQFTLRNEQLLAGGGATGVNSTTGVGAAGVAFYMGGSVSGDVDTVGAELDGCTYPGVIWYLNGSGTTDEVSYMIGHQLQLTTNGCMVTFTGADGGSYAPLIETGLDAQSWLYLDLVDMQLIDGSSNPLAQTTQPAIRNFANANSYIGINPLRSISDTHQVVIEDSGSDRSGINREYDITQVPTQPNQGKRWIQQILRLHDTPQWQTQQLFNIQARGGLQVLQVKNPSKGTATCTAGTGKDYYFTVTAIDGVGHETGAGGVSDAVECNSTLSSSGDYLTLIGATAVGANSYNLYEADVAHGAGAPALSAFRKKQTVAADLIASTPASLTGSPPEFTYYGQANTGGAPPTTNATGESDFGGTVVVPAPAAAQQALSADLSQGESTVANAPGFAFYAISTFAPGAYYKANQASGNLTDSSGNSNTATAHGAGITYSSTGTINEDPDTAITLPGTSGRYFSVVTASSLPSGDGPETWCMGLRNNTGGELFSQGVAGLLLRIDANGQIIEGKQGTGNMFCGGRFITDSNDHYVCVMKNGANNQIVLDGQDVTSPCGGNLTLAPVDGDFNIGADNSGTTNFDGVIDEFMVTKTQLSLAQMQGLEAYWAAPKYGARHWFSNGVPDSCPVTATGAGCPAIFQPIGGWCCGSIIPTAVPTATPTPVPTATASTPTPTATQTPTPTPT